MSLPEDIRSFPVTIGVVDFAFSGRMWADVQVVSGDDEHKLDAAMAWAILYKTGEFLTNYIMDTGEVSRYTLLGTEALNENRVYYNKRYAILVDWLAQNMDDDRNDCLKCKSPMGLRRRTQLI